MENAVGAAYNNQRNRNRLARTIVERGQAIFQNNEAQQVREYRGRGVTRKAYHRRVNGKAPWRGAAAFQAKLFLQLIPKKPRPARGVCGQKQIKLVVSQEELRLQGKEVGRPKTKYAFLRHVMVQLKVIELGEGWLPARLRNRKGTLTLDTFEDNLCVFRCLAVYREAHRLRNTRQAQALSRAFLTPRGSRSCER